MKLRKVTSRITLKSILAFILLGFPIYFPLKMLVNSAIPHWHDTAWGLLLGLENLEKIRLIGYEGGIPGIFYGPHWIWLISLVQIFSKDPVVIATFVLLLPYFVFTPFLVFKFKKLFGVLTVYLLWILYILAYYPNSVHLWHVHLAPIIFLGITYIIITLNWENDPKTNIGRSLILGFLSGLLIYLHMSFGSVIFLSVIFYSFLNIFYKFMLRKKWKVIWSYLIFLILPVIMGVVIASSPFILFELRHNFSQTKRIVYVLSQSFIYNSAVVGQTGLLKIQIIDEFFSIPKTLFQFSQQFRYIWLVIALLLSLYALLKKNFTLRRVEKQFIVFLMVCSMVLLYVYLSSKNPIWNYQFIGVEIIFLLFTGFFISKFPFVKAILTIWIIWLLASMVYKVTTAKAIDPLSVPTLSTKKYIVELIYADSSGKPFSVFAYAPAIYTFDYDYLFKWLGKDKYHYEPEVNKDIVYLVIPDKSLFIREDFTKYKTPNSEFKTTRQWEIGGETAVVKRERNH